MLSLHQISLATLHGGVLRLSVQKKLLSFDFNNLEIESGQKQNLLHYFLILWLFMLIL